MQEVPGVFGITHAARMMSQQPDELGQVIEPHDGDPGLSVGPMQNHRKVFCARVADGLLERGVQPQRLGPFDLEMRPFNPGANVGRFVGTGELAAAASLDPEESSDLPRGLPFPDLALAT